MASTCAADNATHCGACVPAKEATALHLLGTVPGGGTPPPGPTSAAPRYLISAPRTNFGFPPSNSDKL